MLIEDKASDTQLIQELIAEGLHAVTRYQPQSDKVIRMHAQTAMIENGFMHLPDAARWLAQYLHELTSFPNGRYDDRSTRRRSRWTGSSAATAPAPMLGSSIVPAACRGASPKAGAGLSHPPPRPACRRAGPVVFGPPPVGGRRRHGRRDGVRRRTAAARRLGQGRGRRPGRSSRWRGRVSKPRAALIAARQLDKRDMLFSTIPATGGGTGMSEAADELCF